jgi:GDP-L-fucose synthase
LRGDLPEASRGHKREWYAVAKIAGIKMCQAYRRQYGFDAISLPRREFLHVDDLADACGFLMRGYSEAGIVNVGTGSDVSILELARLVAEVVGYAGEIHTDPSKPDGTPRKLMDVGRFEAMGWKARVGLREGVARTYAWFVEQQGMVRG